MHVLHQDLGGVAAPFSSTKPDGSIRFVAKRGRLAQKRKKHLSVLELFRTLCAIDCYPTPRSAAQQIPSQKASSTIFTLVCSSRRLKRYSFFLEGAAVGATVPMLAVSFLFLANVTVTERHQSDHKHQCHGSGHFHVLLGR